MPISSFCQNALSTFGCSLGILAFLGFFAVLARLAVTRRGTATHAQLVWALVILPIVCILALRKAPRTRTRLVVDGEVRWFPNEESALRFLVAHEETSRGHEHRRVADRLRALAEWILRDLRRGSVQVRAGEAEPFYRRVLAIRAKALGAAHLETAISRLEWAGCLRHLGDGEQAAEHWELALEALRNLGTFRVEDDGIADRSGQISSALHRDAAAAADRGHVDEAGELCSLAFRIRQENLPADDPRMANEYCASALFQCDYGRLDDAKALMERAIQLAGPKARTGVFSPEALKRAYANILHRMTKPEPEPDL